MDIFKAISDYEIPEIPEKTRFWMIRAKGGYFYHEFLHEKFVALGWNTITKESSFNKEHINELKDRIKSDYGEKVPGFAINKCINFIHNMKEKDYVIIPNGKYVTIAIVGAYYEDTNLGYDQEIEIIDKIDNNLVNIKEVKCPYRKRRKIQILNTVEVYKLNYRLQDALSSFHGISKLDEYAAYILDAVYGIYSYKGEIAFSINVTKETPIRPREISNLMSGLLNSLCRIVPEEAIQTTLNLNSPGRITVRLKQAYECLRKHHVFLLLLVIIATGGKVKDIELPGFVQVIKDLRTLESQVDLYNLEVEIKKKELENIEINQNEQKLEMISKYIEIKKDAAEFEIDLTNVMSDIELLLEVNSSMEFMATEDLGIMVDSNGIEQDKSVSGGDNDY